jgi:predicted RNA-binding protein Jag
MPTAKTTTKKTAKELVRKMAKKVTLDDVWVTINEIGKGQKEVQKAHAETEAAIKETQAALKETQAALKETQRIVGDLGNKFGDEAEYTLIPGLPEKFKQFGFDFGAISRNRKVNNDKHNIHAEVDAFLENGTQAMAVEVKAKLQKADVDNHLRRMEKLRTYADLFGDRREFFGALAATVVHDKERVYALEKGFYVIEPSGEDVKVTKPDSEPRVW